MSSASLSEWSETLGKRFLPDLCAEDVVERKSQPHAVASVMRDNPGEHGERGLHEGHVEREVMGDGRDGVDSVLLRPVDKISLDVLQGLPLGRIEVIHGDGLRVDAVRVFRTNPAGKLRDASVDGEVRRERDNGDFENIVPPRRKAGGFEVNGGKNVHVTFSY
jgi:hypothetical protein